MSTAVTPTNACNQRARTTRWARALTLLPTLSLATACATSQGQTQAKEPSLREHLRRWKSTGIPMEEGWLKAGKRTGRWSFYDQKGNLLRSGHYKSGNMEGTWRYWYRGDTNQLKSEYHYKNGRLHGKRMGWYKNGQLHLRSELRHGVRHGVTEAFRNDGRLWSRTHFSRGKRDGPSEKVDRFGIRRTGLYKANLKHGPWTIEDASNKNVIAREEWLHGKQHGEQIEYWSNGEKRVLETRRRGVRHGLYTRWDEPGLVVQSGYYIDGEKTGKWTSNFPGTESPSAINHFSRGVPDGIQEHYREDPHSLHERTVITKGELRQVTRFSADGSILESP